MTKRILAIVMAVVMCMSMLAVEVFADTTNMDITATASGTTVSVSWNAVSGAATYDVELYQNGNRINYQTGIKTTSTTLSTNNSYGTFTVNVTARNTSGGIAGSGSKSVEVPFSSTYNGISVSSNGSSSVTVSWTSKSYITTYYVSWTGKASGSTTVSNSGTTCTATISAAYSDLTSITVREGASNGTLVGTWYPTNPGNTPGVGGVTLDVQNAKLYWNAVSNAVGYIVTYRVGNGTEYSLNTVTGNLNLSVDVSYVLRTYYTSSVTFTVYYYTSYNTSYRQTLGYATYNYGQTGGSQQTGAVYLSGTTLYWNYNGNDTFSVYVNNQYWTRTTSKSINISAFTTGSYGSVVTFEVRSSSNVSIGTATYNVLNGGGSGYGNGFRVTVYNGYIDVSWNTVYGAADYIVSYTINGQAQGNRTGGATTYRIPFTAGRDTVSVTVNAQATYGGYGDLIGSATINANGAVTYTGGSYTPTNPSTTGRTVTGSNCYIVVGTSSSTLYWNNTGYYSQEVIYNYNGRTFRQSVNSGVNYAIIPLGSTASFDAFVTANGQVIAYVTVTGNTSNSNGSYTKTEIEGVTLTEVSGGTKVSWDPVTGADFYTIDYAPLAGNAGDTTVTATTSVTIPYTKRSAFLVRVYAHLTYGGGRNVGHAIHLANDPYTTSTSDKDNNTTTTPTAPEYVTNFKAVSGNKKVTLSWNAVKGNPDYTVYWKRSTSTEWKKAGTISKRSVNVTGLNNGVSYDFKITANGRDSGIVTISPQSSGSTTKTAADPAGAGTTAATVPEITSVESGKGSMTITWNGVANGTNYQIWIAKSDSKTYAISTHKDYFPNAVTTINGTTATITGLAAGTYKVRIKASTDGGKTYTALGDCDYRTVTVQ